MEKRDRKKERTQRLCFVRRERGSYYTRDTGRKEGRESHGGGMGGKGGVEGPNRD